METSDRKLIKKTFKVYLKIKNYYEKKEYKKCETRILYLIDTINQINKESEYYLKYNNELEEINKEMILLLKEINLNQIENSVIESDILETDHEIFNLIKKGSFKSLIEKLKNNPDINLEFFNEDGLTPLHLCIKNGDMKCLIELLKYSGKINMLSENGLTLFEYACLQKDHNTINVLNNFGASMDKHLELRMNSINKIKTDELDELIILKKIFETTKRNKLKIIPDQYLNKIDFEKKCKYGNFDYRDLIYHLDKFLENLDSDQIISYLNIINEEIDEFNECQNKICPKSIISIITSNLAIFIDYPFNFSTPWILNLEISFILKNILKKETNKREIRKKLVNKIYSDYIETNLYSPDFIGVIINNWIKKI